MGIGFLVYLLAATVGRTTCEQAASLSITTNLAGINNVLQLCKRTESVCVFISTSEVYGPGCDVLDEAHSTPRPGNRYGLSKWLCEQLVEYEVRTAGLRAVTLRPCMLYEEQEDIGEHRSAMIRFASGLARGRRITLDVMEGQCFSGRKAAYNSLTSGVVISREQALAKLRERHVKVGVG